MSNITMEQEIEFCRKYVYDIGPIKSTVQSESNGLRTVMSQHDKGFSITHYRRFFKHLLGVEIPGSSEWKVVRHQQWSSTKLFDIADSSYQEQEPSQPIQGDVDG